MRATHEPTTPQRPSAVHRDPADLAPSADRSWANDFVLEQRLLGVPGTQIGDALVTIESHLVDSGESALEAFGDARAYAAELAESSSAVDDAITPRTVVASVLGVIGMLTTVYAFGPWLAGEPATITVGLVVSGALLLAVLALFLANADAVLRMIVERVWLTAVAVVLVTGATVVALLLLTGVLVQVPGAVLLAAGATLLVLDAVLNWLDHGQGDTVLAPGESAPVRAAGRVLSTLTVPAFTLLMLGLAWLVHSLA
ncbi:hypothetical protein [Ornithinimicrobium cryptoxanthini]|uniref:Uncharacterized protein n=1 Tax=Ornithinimicrobium cryptoxanthini TaxID=2934161 RepID=A0ABY4YG48_9MICO|nr:hypothetical protein [Ornithinimicrobium cryptoxanthini]USQ75602.1 hypothetical protein NF557_13420 [Ornithinimicrobium cryptoxanthini]